MKAQAPSHLSSCDLLDCINNHELIIIGLDDGYPFHAPSQLQPASIDLRLGRRFYSFEESVTAYDIKDIKNAERYTVERFYEEDEPIELPPGRIVFGQVYEQIILGNCLSAVIKGKSRVARLGISVNCTGDYINPGFKGAMPLQLINHNDFLVKVYPYTFICQLLVFRLASQPLVPYSELATTEYPYYYNEQHVRPSTLTSPVKT